jgi:hypothetical protein
MEAFTDGVYGFAGTLLERVCTPGVELNEPQQAGTSLARTA